MKSYLSKWSGFLGVVFLFGSCAPTAHVEKDDTVNLHDFKTFTWMKKDDKKSSGKVNLQDLTEQKIKEAVNKELAKSSGWKEVKHNPDVILTYDVLVERGTKESSNPVYSRPFSRIFYNPYSRRYVTVFYPSQFIGYDRDIRPIKEGTVTISMIDGKTDKVVWQGWTTDEVNSRNMTSKEIQYAVRSIFRKFDIAKN